MPHHHRCLTRNYASPSVMPRQDLCLTRSYASSWYVPPGVWPRHASQGACLARSNDSPGVMVRQELCRGKSYVSPCSSTPQASCLQIFMLPQYASPEGPRGCPRAKARANHRTQKSIKTRRPTQKPFLRYVSGVLSVGTTRAGELVSATAPPPLGASV